MTYRNETILREYCRKNAGKMLRQPKGKLTHPYLDPASEVYSENLWDWDSFWAGKALIDLGVCERERLYAHLKGCVENFFDLAEPDGYVPVMATAEGQFEQVLSFRRKKGQSVNQHKPFLCQSALQAAQYGCDFSWLKDRIGLLEDYLGYYRKRQFHTPSGLYVFANDIMVGGDNDPAVFGRPDYSAASLILNCFLVLEMDALKKIKGELGLSFDPALEQQRQELAQAIESQCYDAATQFYYSADVLVETHRDEVFHHGLGAFWKSIPVKIRQWTGFLPLYTGIASPEHAMAVVKRHFHDQKFFCDYGIRTLACDERMYSTEPSGNPSNWLGPVWGLSNHIVFEALKRYGYDREALVICEQTAVLFARDIEQNGHMSESYDPETGAGMLCPGFLNWNLLVVEMLDKIAAQKLRGMR